jgi:hypothetical protein
MDQEFQKAPQKSEAGYLYRRKAHFIDKVFKGANPADLPIERPNQI